MAAYLIEWGRKMTTYNTYQEAKINNPGSDIYRFDKAFTTDSNRYGFSFPLCRPSDYCMTVERFLADGYKFVEGDVYLCAFGDANVVGDEFAPGELNEPDDMDCDRFILRAAALEKKPKPTKFVKVEESIFDLKEEFERGELYFSEWSEEKTFAKINKEHRLMNNLASGNVYRQVEIDWRDEMAEFTGLGKDFYTWVDCINDMYNFDFVEMCHRVAELTDKPE